jgi:hypothetical protein
MINRLRDLEAEMGKKIVKLLKEKGLDLDKIKEVLNDPYRLQQMAEAAGCAPP